MSNELTIVQTELSDIMQAGARALKQPGIELMPIKRDMLRISDSEAALVLETCYMLFAAILSYEGALWDIENAQDALSLVSARIETGRAKGVVESLFFGPTKRLIEIAMDHAPIAFYAMCEASPDLMILERLTGRR